ncbi:hypothetical protein MY4824_003940 [Beauveria thailandica]
MPSSDLQSRYDGPPDLYADRERLRQPRPAAEPVPRTADDFYKFILESYQLTKDGIMANAFHTIRGPNVYKNANNLLCSNFASMTSNQATHPKPDYLEPANKTDVNQVLVRELASLILPSVQGQYHMLPIAPNLIVEVKSSVGCIRTALR